MARSRHKSSHHMLIEGDTSMRDTSMLEVTGEIVRRSCLGKKLSFVDLSVADIACIENVEENDKDTSKNNANQNQSKIWKLMFRRESPLWYENENSTAESSAATEPTSASSAPFPTKTSDLPYGALISVTIDTNHPATTTSTQQTPDEHLVYEVHSWQVLHHPKEAAEQIASTGIAGDGLSYSTYLRERGQQFAQAAHAQGREAWKEKKLQSSNTNSKTKKRPLGRRTTATNANSSNSPYSLFHRRDHPTLGRQLIASCYIPKGRLLFCERPLVALQSLGNPVWVCHCCKAFVGGPEAALHILAHHEIPTAQKDDNERDNSDSNREDYQVIPCRHNCGQVYCSIECEQDYWQARHRFLCTGLISDTVANNNDTTASMDENLTQSTSATIVTQEQEEQQHPSHPLLRFKHHAIQTNEIFLLVAEWIVAEFTYAEQLEGCSNFMLSNNNDPMDPFFTIKNPFEDFMMAPWWDIEEDDKEEDRQVLKQLCETAAICWNQHWSGVLQDGNDGNQHVHKNTDDTIPQQQKSQGEGSSVANGNSTKALLQLHMANIIGACELNSIGIRRRNTLCRDVFDKDLRRAKKAELIKCLEQAGMLQSAESDSDDEVGEEDQAGNDKSTGCIMESDTDAKISFIDQPLETKLNDEDEWEYTDDDLAQFLADLDIFEEETSEGKKENNNTVKSTDAIPDDEKCCDDDHGDFDNDDLDVLFSPLDGTAMYALACKMNHSCDPNVAILYKTRGYGSRHPLVAHAVALKDIAAGEELCISYIDHDAPFAQRQIALKHYGFTCQCGKCESERCMHLATQEGNRNDITKATEDRDIAAEEENFLFGSDDSDDDDNSSEAVADNNATSNFHAEDVDSQVKANGSGEEALQRCLGRLDTALNHTTMGPIPLQFLAQVSAFVIKLATTSLGRLRGSNNVSLLLEQCIQAMREKDFILAQIVGADLENVLFSLLKKESQWPNPAFREAFWCSSVTAATGLAHASSFLEAVEYLDKALILGMDRHAIQDFFSYVELHSGQMAMGPFLPAIGGKVEVPDYSSPRYSKLALNCLTKRIDSPLPECNKGDEGMILSQYISQATPIVVRKYASAWPATQKWRHLTFFCRFFGHRTVPIELGAMRSEAGMKEELMTLRRFSAMYLAKSAEREYWTLRDATDARTSGEIAYLAQHPLVEQLPILSNDLDMKPFLCGSDGPTNVYLWVGTGGTRTPLHFDSYSNIFVQLVGIKYIRIYGEDQTPKLYVSKKESFGLQGNMSDVDCEQEDFARHPLAKGALYREVLLFPGDALFIPAWTWHYVRSLSTSISVNFWFDADAMGQLVQKQSTLKPATEQETTCNDDLIGHGDKVAKAKRAKLFATWLLETFGTDLLRRGSGVLDIAGGKGHLAIELAVAGKVPCTVVDPLVRKQQRSFPVKRDAKRIRKVGAPLPKHLATFFNKTSFLEEYGVNNEPPENGKQGNKLAKEEQGVMGDISDSDLVSEASCLVGLHPDQTTEDILDVALQYNKPVAIVPCCVFPTFFPQRKLKNGAPVVTYEHFCQYLLERDPSLEQDVLPFQGRNAVIYRRQMD